MKAEELRIGNYIRTILSKNDYDIVTSISTQKVKDGIYETVCVNYEYQDKSILLHHCSPIPLSEQWLLDFGFKKSDDVNDRFGGYLSPEFQNCRLRIRQGENIIGGLRNSGWYFKVNESIFVYTNHVHELQNYWHSLTNKELK